MFRSPSVTRRRSRSACPCAGRGRSSRSPPTPVGRSRSPTLAARPTATSGRGDAVSRRRTGVRYAADAAATCARPRGGRRDRPDRRPRGRRGTSPPTSAAAGSPPATTPTGAAVVLGSVVIDGAADPTALVRIPLAMFNRHGLVAGATGTGKTKTLQVHRRAALGRRRAGADPGRQGRPDRPVRAGRDQRQDHRAGRGHR